VYDRSLPNNMRNAFYATKKVEMLSDCKEIQQGVILWAVAYEFICLELLVG